MKTLLFIPILFASLFSIASAQSTIFIVRHAEKATDGDAKDPDLSATGRARAEAWATVLKDANITAIYATELKRTQQTAEPFAKFLGIPVTVTAAKETDSLVAKLKSAQGNVLVVGHSNTIPDILKSLGATTSMTIEDPDYDNLFAVTLTSPPQLIRLHLPSHN